ncbi:MAG: acetolactate synthase small subunit [Eggerthella lenta]
MLSVWWNKPGVLSRVTGLISRRGFQHRVAGGPPDPTCARHGHREGRRVAQADHEAAHKLISVHKITDLTNDAAIERELVLFKVNAQPDRRNEIIEIANVFRAKIVDVGRSSLTIEATGDESKLKGMEDLFRAYGIKEITRTGKIAMSRNSKDV